MGILHINLRYSRVVLDHLQRAVPEQCLKREEVTTRPQIRDRKRVAKTVRVNLEHTCRLSEVAQCALQQIACDRPIVSAQEKRRVVVLVIGSIRQISPE